MPIGKGKPAAKTAAAASPTGGVGLRPENFVEGGGLYDDFDGTILEMAFVEFDYDGTVDPPILALAAEIRNNEVEEEKGKNPFVQHYSAGDLKEFTPSDDGKEAVPVGSKTGLSKNCNAYAFLMSMLDAGFPPDNVGSRVDIFEGTTAHFKREDQPERKGLAADPNGRKKQVLLVESIKALPGEEAVLPKKVAAAASKSATTTKSAGTNSSVRPTIARNGAKKVHGIDGTIAELAYGYLVEKIAEGTNGGVQRAGLAKDVFKWAKENKLEIPQRNGVLQAVGNEDFLSAENDYFTFDGDTLTLKG